MRDATQEVQTEPAVPTAGEGRTVVVAQPVLVGERQAAALCGVSSATFRRWHSRGLVPNGVKVSGRVLWRYQELFEWANSRMPGNRLPDRAEWEAMSK